MNSHRVFDQWWARPVHGARLRALGVVAAALSLAIAGTATAAASAPVRWGPRHPAAAGTWVTTPMPAADTDILLNDVVSFGASDAWVVGEREVSDVPFQTADAVLRWDGTQWADTGPTTTDGALVAVAGTSSSNLWTTGTDDAGAEVDHFDGTTWTTMALPDESLGPVTPTNIAAAGTNAWIVGNIDVGFPLTKAAIEEWTGTAWVAQPIPPSSSGQTELGGVFARTATDVWAVGSQRADASSPFHPYVLHWNGTAWSEIASPFQPTDSLLNAVVATGPNQILVGGRLGNTGSGDQSFAMSWNGTAWTVTPAPSTGLNEGNIETLGLDGATPWAGGASNSGVLQFNGGSWVDGPRPVPEDPFGTPIVDALASVPSGGIWSIGHNVGTNSGPNFLSFIARMDG